MSTQDILLLIRGGFSGGQLGLGLLVAIGLLLLVVVPVLLFTALYARSTRGRVDAALAEREQYRPSSRWPVRVAVLVLAGGSLVAVTYGMGESRVCGQCHDKPDYAATVKDSAHRAVACLGCHGEAGVTGAVVNMASYGRWIYVYTSQKERPKPAGTFIADDACLRCHEEVKSGVITSRNIRVRHGDFLNAGAHCRDCHNSIAHGDAAVEPTSPSMDDCLPCHDGTKASSECATCHVRDEYLTAVDAKRLPKIRNLDTSGCYACHDEKPCLRCHGVTMPHPKGWGPEDGGPGASGSHAKQGFTDRELCWRCHFSNGKPFQRPATNGGFASTTDGCTCHGSFGNMHGGAAWVAEHGLQATGKKTGPEAECFMCHDARVLCDQCHESSMKNRYAPVAGPEKYQRDIPKPKGYWEY